MMPLNQFSQPLVAEELPFAVHGLGYSVRMEDDDVAGVQRDAPFVVTGLLKNAQRKSGQLDLSAAGVLIKERLRLTGIGHAEFAPSFLPRREASGHEAAFNAPFAN